MPATGGKHGPIGQNARVRPRSSSPASDVSISDFQKPKNRSSSHKAKRVRFDDPQAGQDTHLPSTSNSLRSGRALSYDADDVSCTRPYLAEDCLLSFPDVHLLCTQIDDSRGF